MKKENKAGRRGNFDVSGSHGGQSDPRALSAFLWKDKVTMVTMVVNPLVMLITLSAYVYVFFFTIKRCFIIWQF